MPILNDARELLEIDRERLRLAREAQDVNREALQTAQELARIGDDQRPKTEEFLRNARGAAPAPGTQPLPTPGAMSSGGTSGGGASTGGGNGSGGLTGRTVVSRGGVVRAEEWVQTHCSQIEVEIPRPGSPRPDDFVKVMAWDCSEKFGEMGLPTEDEAAIFYDLASLQSFLPARVGVSQSGGPSGGGGGTRSSRNDPRNDGRVPINRGGSSDPRVPTTSSGTADPRVPSVGSSTVPSADGRLVARTLKEEFGVLRQELRAGGDFGLQIRRNGGL